MESCASAHGLWLDRGGRDSAPNRCWRMRRVGGCARIKPCDAQANASLFWVVLLRVVLVVGAGLLGDFMSINREDNYGTDLEMSAQYRGQWAWHRAPLGQFQCAAVGEDDGTNDERSLCRKCMYFRSRLLVRMVTESPDGFGPLGTEKMTLLWRTQYYTLAVY